MQKKFYGSLILIILLNVLVKPFYIFAIDAQVQNTVGSADYGVYFSLLNFSFLFNIVLDIGITNYNTKNIAQHPHTVSKYIGSILGLRFLLALGYFSITIGAALLLGYKDLEMKILSMLALNQILAGLILYFRSNFSGLHWFKIDAVLSVLDRLLLIGIGSILLYSSWIQEPFQIEWFVYAQTVSYGVTAVVALVLSRVKLGPIKLRVRKVFNRALLKQSTPYALLILLMMMYTRMDAVMIERLLPDGKVQAGIYAQGFRLLDVVNMFAFLVAGLLLPIFARMIKQRVDIRPILQSAGLLLVGTATLVGIVCSSFSEILMELIYRQDTSSSSVAFSWIILSFIPMAISHIFGTLLTANGSMRLLNQMALGGIVVNFSMNLILIPYFKAEGAAIATLITQGITALAQAILAMRVFRLSFDFLQIGKVVLFAAILIGIYQFLPVHLHLSGLLIVLASGVVLLFLLRIVNLREILLLLKERE